MLEMGTNNQEVIVMGWVRTFRNNQFIALNDGSTNTQFTGSGCTWTNMMMSFLNG